MPVHAERRQVPFAPERMFDLVADVGRYPEFLPWCAGARVRSRERADGLERMTADLIVAYKVFRERFTSRVTLDRPGNRIEVEYLDGPFTHLVNKWVFHPRGEGTEVEFYVDFAFRSRTLQKMIETRFAEAVMKMGEAFETRAHELYQAPAQPVGGG